jgi:hypothetical protein
MKHKLKGIAETREVWLDGKLLSPERSLGIRKHSPDGFNWGYGGSGPAQLALAVVLEVNNTYEGYQDFKFNTIARLTIDKDFEIEFDLNFIRAKRFMATKLTEIIGIKKAGTNELIVMRFQGEGANTYMEEIARLTPAADAEIIMEVMVESWNKHNKLITMLGKAIKEEVNKFESNKAAADWFNNNTPNVGITINYQNYAPLPDWVKEAKDLIEL